MKLSYLFLGLAAMLPASILLFSLWEFALINPNESFFRALGSAFWVAFVSVWSFYIISIGGLLKNKKVPTSLEGMLSTMLVSLGYALTFVLFEYFILKVDFTVYTLMLTLFGILAAGAVQGFYIGYSKARFSDDEAKGFVFRQVGLVESTLVLTPFIFLSFRAADDWVLSSSAFFILLTVGVLGVHYVRAQRQSRNYLSRRYKNKTDYATAGHHPEHTGITNTSLA
jgi:small-conductance mechanosensitive channel